MQRNRVCEIAQDLGLFSKAALEATIHYCNTLSEDGPLTDTHLELIVQTYYAGFEKGIELSSIR